MTTNSRAAPALKIFGECYPINSWYETWDNGTIFKGEGLHVLKQFHSKFVSGIEIVTELSQSSVTHPVVNLLLLKLSKSIHYSDLRLYLGTDGCRWRGGRCCR